MFERLLCCLFNSRLTVTVSFSLVKIMFQSLTSVGDAMSVESIIVIMLWVICPFFPLAVFKMLFFGVLHFHHEI